MQRASIGWGVVVTLAFGVLVGCAVGTDPDGTGIADLAALPVEAGSGDEKGASLPPSNHPHDEEDTGTGPVDDAGTPGTDAATATDAGTGTDAGGSDAGTGSCASTNTCLAATDLGSISGDTGADSKTAQGSTSQWFKVRVTENDSSLFGVTLLVKAELTSPPGTNFDVFVYVPGGSSGQECSAVSASSTNPTTFDSAGKEWGEGAISNGNDDSRTVTVEVRWVSGTCNPAAPWSLTVRGDTP